MTNKEYALTVDAIAQALNKLEATRELVGEVGFLKAPDLLNARLDQARFVYQALRDLGDTLAIPQTAVIARADELKG